MDLATVDRVLRGMRPPTTEMTLDDWRQDVVEYLLKRGGAAPSTADVRHACRRVVTNEFQRAQKHTDEWGRPLGYRGRYVKWEPVHASPVDDAPRLAARAQIAYLRKKLNKAEFDTLVQGVVGDAVDARTYAYIVFRARRILDPESMAHSPFVPPCHVDGEQPQGYDPAETKTCPNCIAKLTCLPSSVKKRLTQAPLTVDLEVWAHSRGLISVEDVTRRIVRREKLEAKGVEPEPEELCTWEGLRESDTFVEARAAATKELVEKPVAEVIAKLEKGEEVYYLEVGARSLAKLRKTPEGWTWEGRRGWVLRDCESAEPEETFSRVVRAALATAGIAAERAASARRFSAVKKVRGRGRPRKAKPKRDPNASPKRRGRPPTVPETWPRMKGGAIYPRPRKISPEVMELRLAQVQRTLGANIKLRYGMKLVRRLNSGDEVVCEITPEGFRVTVDAELAAQAQIDTEQVFSSLSSVAQWADGRVRSGADYFHISRHTCTEIWDEHNRIIDRRGGVPQYLG